MDQEFYLATYTTRGGSGIGRGRINPATGRPEVAFWTGSAVPEPSWLELATAPDGRRQTLYAVSELSPNGLVNAVRVLDGGGLALLNSSQTGTKPAHLAIHPSQRFVITSMYDGGSISVHPMTNGSIGAVCDTSPLRQPITPRGPENDVDLPVSHLPVSHAHQVVPAPDGDCLLAVDLGLDTVVSYRLDVDSGRLSELGRTRMRPGSGPRHLVFHPHGKHVYLANELDSTVSVCRFADGVLTELDWQTTRSAILPTTGGVRNYPGELVVSADGRFLYLTNRGDNAIAVFALHDDGARVELQANQPSGGDWPRHLALDRTGGRLYVANERSGDVTWFPIDPASGLLGEALGRLPVPGVAQVLLI